MLRDAEVVKMAAKSRNQKDKIVLDMDMVLSYEFC